MGPGFRRGSEGQGQRVLAPLTLPRVILGLDPGICRASASAAGVVIVRASAFPNPFTGFPMQRIPGSSPRMTMGVGLVVGMEPRGATRG
ncbi:hypothetical protein SAMN05428936_11110 [Pelagibacterium halotolerans]|nr:hypothetical protein SAMN05428936_11110 [Pelagibacterium halotolerans]